jgi:hypothetical protein
MKDVNRRATRRDSDVKQLVYLKKKSFFLSNYLNIFSNSTKRHQRKRPTLYLTTVTRTRLIAN